MSNPISAVLGWLRAGYPDGVPPKDFFPLLALLESTLSEEELRSVTATLIRENPEGEIREEDVWEAIARRTDSPVSSADVRDVASRLAAAGWPLSTLPDADAPPHSASDAGDAPAESSALGADGDGSGEGEETDSRRILQRIVDWLAVGYPQGVPPTDRVPLVALLGRALSEQEAEEIAAMLVHQAQREGESIAPADAGALITQFIDQDPSKEDLERVSARLAAKGWPLQR